MDTHGRPSCLVVVVSFVAVSVTRVFLQDRVVNPEPNPQPGGPVVTFLSGLYPLTCPAWVALPGDKSPAGIALGVIEAHKLPDQQQGK